MEEIRMKLSKLRRQLMLAQKSMRHRLNPEEKPSTLIVAGCQRSGTNMVMDMLERHSDTTVYHERDARAYDNYIMRDIEVIRGLYNQCRARSFVIKALCELHMLALLRTEFAPAKVLWVVRRWPDVTNSLVRSFDGFSDNLQAIASDRQSAGWRGLGMSDRTHSVIRELAQRRPDELSAAAAQWYFRNMLYLEYGFDKDPDVLLLSYEALVGSPREGIRAVCEFAGLPFQPRMLGDISPRSIGKNPAPVVDEQVATLCEGLYNQLVTTGS